MPVSGRAQLTVVPLSTAERTRAFAPEGALAETRRPTETTSPGEHPGLKRLGILRAARLPGRPVLKSASASQYTDTYNHPPRPDVTAPPTADPSTPVAPRSSPQLSKSRPGRRH